MKKYSWFPPDVAIAMEAAEKPNYTPHFTYTFDQETISWYVEGEFICKTKPDKYITQGE